MNDLQKPSLSSPKFNRQPVTLSDEFVQLVPLSEDDFERLFAVASDPLIWEQHPAYDRYLREVFQAYFDSALVSKGAFIVIDNRTGEVIGSTRYYDLDQTNSSVKIGFTFLARSCWGNSHNRSTKKLLLDYAFQFVNNVFLEVGITNFRSQKAVEKLGAIKVYIEQTEENGEANSDVNYTYKIDRDKWLSEINDQ